MTWLNYNAFETATHGLKLGVLSKQLPSTQKLMGEKLGEKLVKGP